MPTELQGTVVNSQDTPLKGAIVTLIGGEAPQVQATMADGQFHFSDLTPGTYKLSVVMKGCPLHLRSDIVVETDKVSTITITMDAPSSNQKLTVQNVALSLIAAFFAFFLFKGLLGPGGFNAMDLGKEEVARGVITYLVSVGTITIAMVLVLSVILGSETGNHERFARGKEVLTILIGVLGTIIGFYYGSSVKDVKAEPAAIQMATVEVSPDKPVVGTPIRLSASVVGGLAPYTYSIYFTDTAGNEIKDSSGKEVILPVVNQPSSNGNIRQDISIPATAPPSEISFKIVVKDKEGTTYTYNDKGEQTITLLPPAAK
ncbi:MAG TPA: carboxypeptidase-like regulatory domain-containing protein [Blastocatellia bacterium]